MKENGAYGQLGSRPESIYLEITSVEDCKAGLVVESRVAARVMFSYVAVGDLPRLF